MTCANRSAVQGIGAWLTAAALIVAASSVAAAQASTKKFIIHEAPKPIGAILFEDGHGQPRSLADFRGKVILLNIWATWCVPCRKEMPTLDRLQAALGGSDFEVVPLSIDRRGMEVVRQFFAEVGIRDLQVYLDGSGKASRALGVVGLPTTLLVDRQGQEIGRLIGPAEWDGSEMVGLIRCMIARDDPAHIGVEPNSHAAASCVAPELDLPASVTGANRQP